MPHLVCIRINQFGSNERDSEGSIDRSRPPLPWTGGEEEEHGQGARAAARIHVDLELGYKEEAYTCMDTVRCCRSGGLCWMGMGLDRSTDRRPNQQTGCLTPRHTKPPQTPTGQVAQPLLPPGDRQRQRRRAPAPHHSRSIRISIVIPGTGGGGRGGGRGEWVAPPPPPPEGQQRQRRR